VSVGEGETKEIEVHPGPLAPVTSVDVSARGGSRTLGWIVGGVGVAGVATGVVTGLMLASRRSTLESACPNKSCTSQSDVDLASSAKPLLAVNAAAWIAGGVGLGLGAFLILSGSRSRPAAALVPQASPNSAALSCVGTF
jgi:hypothetical protein